MHLLKPRKLLPKSAQELAMNLTANNQSESQEQSPHLSDFMSQETITEYAAPLVALGICMATVGATISGIGMNLMKSSHQLERHLPLLKRRRFLIGVSMACWINTILDCIAFALTPLSIVAPIGGITIVSSVISARTGRFGLKESVSCGQWISIVLVVFGVAIVDVFGPHPDPVLNTTNVLQQLYNNNSSMYQLASFILIALVYAGLHLGVLKAYHISTTILTATAGGMCSGITQTMMKALAISIASWAIGESFPWKNGAFWIAMLELGSVAFILLHMLNLCLVSSPLALSTTLYQVAVIVFTIVAGCAFYGELAYIEQSHLVAFFCGVVCVVGGLAFLLIHRESSGELVSTQENRPSNSRVASPPNGGLEETAESTTHEKTPPATKGSMPKRVRESKTMLNAILADPDPDL